MNVIKKYNLSLLKKQYEDNEQQANRAVSYVSLVFVAICVFNEIVLEFDYSSAIHLVNNYLFMPVCAIIILFFIIARIRHYADPWVKYMLLTGVILMSLGSFFAYTTYISYIVFLPVFVSERYFNRKFMIQIFLMTLTLFQLVCVAGIILEKNSTIIQMLHESSSFNSWTRPIDAASYIIVPMTLTFLFMAAHCVNVTVSGQRFLKSKVASMTRTAAVEIELNMASEIQKSALPNPSFVTPDGHFRVAAREIPAKEVCGDFYDYFIVQDHTLVILIADVSDKGAPAAMFMMSAKKALQCAIQCCHNLTEAVRLANTLICQDNKSDMFLTLWLGMIDTRSGMGKYINAGHPLPYIRHGDGRIESLDNPPDLFLGNFPDMPPQVNMFRMTEEDTLLLFTDGITDAMNNNDSSFGTANLAKAVKSSPCTAEGVIDTVINAVNDFIKEKEPFDDTTLLALQCVSLDSAAEFSLEVAADKSGTKTVIDRVNELLEEIDCPDEKRRNIDVVCDEIGTNIADYAYNGSGGFMTVDVRALSNFMTIRFTDLGVPFNPLEWNDPDFPDEPMIGGLGIYFVKSLTDRQSYCRQENKNVFTVTFLWNM